MTTSDKASSRDQSAPSSTPTSDGAERVRAACALLEPVIWGADLLAAAKEARPFSVHEARELHLAQVGKIAAALDATPEEDPRKALLAMQITGGKLVMSIGVEALAMAIEGGPMFEEGTVVTDHDAFAKEVLTALQDEDEVGNNLIYRAFDAALEVLAEESAEGITFSGEAD